MSFARKKQELRARTPERTPDGERAFITGFVVCVGVFESFLAGSIPSEVPTQRRPIQSTRA